MQADKSEAQEDVWLEAGDYLKLEMARKGYNAVTLAEKIGITPQSIYNITGATRRPISAGLALKLAQELGGSIEFWLGDRFPNYAIGAAATAGLGPNPQGIQVDRRLVELNGSDDDGFIISPLDESQVQGASIDLTMGLFIKQGFGEIAKEARDCWFSFHQLELDGTQFTEEQKRQFENLRKQKKIQYAADIELGSGGSIIVVAAQYVRMGLRYVGLLGQTTEGNLRGLVVHCGHQVDPGFNGPLIFRVKNDSDAMMVLRRGDPLASITVVALPEPVRKGYGKNRASQIRGVLDKLRVALAGSMTISEVGAGWQIAFRDQLFSGVSRTSVVSAFFTWVDGQLANNGEAIYALLANTPLERGDIESLGSFLGRDSSAIDFASSQAENGEKARLFGKAVTNLTDTPSEVTEAYRRVCAELRGLATDLGGFDIGRG